MKTNFMKAAKRISHCIGIREKDSGLKKALKVTAMVAMGAGTAAMGAGMAAMSPVIATGGLAVAAAGIFSGTGAFKHDEIQDFKEKYGLSKPERSAPTKSFSNSNFDM